MSIPYSCVAFVDSSISSRFRFSLVFSIAVDRGMCLRELLMNLMSITQGQETGKADPKHGGEADKKEYECKYVSLIDSWGSKADKQ